MNFRFVILALAVAALALTSCKKDKPEEPEYGPANTMTVDGTARQITIANGWTYNMGYDQEALGVGFMDGTIKHWLSIGIAHDQYGTNFSLADATKFWDIGYTGYNSATYSSAFFYECYWNDVPATITGGHVYIKRTGNGGMNDFGAYILRFDVTFADGRRVYGNYSGIFEADNT